MKRTSSFASNKFYYRFIRNLFLLLGIFFILAAALGAIFPEFVIINGEPISIDGVIVLCSLSLFFLVVFVLVRNKITYAVINSFNIILITSKTRHRFLWDEVEISQLRFIFPPVYKIVTPDRKIFFFNTENKFIASPFGLVTDLSEMGHFIKRKMR